MHCGKRYKLCGFDFLHDSGAIKNFWNIYRMEYVIGIIPECVCIVLAYDNPDNNLQTHKFPR